MKKLGIIAGVTAGGVLAVLCAGSFLLSSFAVNGRRQTLEESYDWQKNHYDVSWYDGLEKTDYIVKGYQGYELHVQLMKCGKETDQYVIISHGHTDTRYGALKYAKTYLDADFNCIIYDLRGHGANEPAPCTYSILEGQDLAALIADTRERYGQEIFLGIHGESLGAATTVRSLEYSDQVDFAVADCGFADITNVLKVGISWMHLPKWMVSFASIANRIRYGYFFSQMEPVQALAGNQVPILFIHGEADNFIVPDNSVRMQKATSGYSELHLIPGAGHAESVLVEPELYTEYVLAFLQKIHS